MKEKRRVCGKMWRFLHFCRGRGNPALFLPYSVKTRARVIQDLAFRILEFSFSTTTETFLVGIVNRIAGFPCLRYSLIGSVTCSSCFWTIRCIDSIFVAFFLRFESIECVFVAFLSWFSHNYFLTIV